jgi:SAM-dependent methyltransferase
MKPPSISPSRGGRHRSSGEFADRMDQTYPTRPVRLIVGFPIGAGRRVPPRCVATVRRSTRGDAAAHPRVPGSLGPASKTLMTLVGEFTADPKWPLLDAGCGYGRNAVALASFGLSVVCVDQKLERLKALSRLAPTYVADLKKARCKAGQLYPVLADLDPSQWPFRGNCFSAIVCVHFLKVALIGAFHSSLVAGGRLYIETFGGHGGNYFDLPKEGQLRDLLSTDFDLLLYREKKVGPAEHNAVTVKLFARKRLPSDGPDTG